MGLLTQNARNPLVDGDYPPMACYSGLVKLARLARCAVRTALVPSLRAVSSACHNPQHRMSRVPVRHASDMPILRPRTLLLTV